MRKLTVKILVSVTDPARFDACTLCFPSIRVGFPTADIQVRVNNVSTPETTALAIKKVKEAGITDVFAISEIHHAEFIRRSIEVAAAENSRLVIVDPDTIFWKCCEDWRFGNALMAGYYVPKMWNDFAQCVSFPRLHTSHLWFPNPSELLQYIRNAYPWSHHPTGNYCPCDPFMPATRFISGRPYFWDTCCNLFQILGYERCAPFDTNQLESFDHLNSASFFDVMASRIPQNGSFILTHNVGVKHPESLRNLWPEVENYYAQKQIEADLRQPGL